LKALSIVGGHMTLTERHVLNTRKD
jgi:hypothetical protein